MSEQQITIPTIGTQLVLTAPWAFSLYHESRNGRLLDALGIERNYRYGSGLGRSEVVFPAGTKLTVDRIYVRKGVGSYDSVTFVLKKGNHPGDKKIYGRFWTKLGDVNRIRCDFVEDTVKRDTEVSPLRQLAAESD